MVDGCNCAVLYLVLAVLSISISSSVVVVTVVDSRTSNYPQKSSCFAIDLFAFSVPCDICHELLGTVEIIELTGRSRNSQHKTIISEKRCFISIFVPNLERALQFNCMRTINQSECGNIDNQHFVTGE